MLQLIIYLNQKSLVSSTLKKEGGHGFCMGCLLKFACTFFAVAKEVSEVLGDFFCPDNNAIIEIWENKSVIQCIHCFF